MEFRYDGSHHIQNLGVSRIWYVTAVIDEYGIQEMRNDISIDHLVIVCFLNIAINKFQDFFLNGPKSTDFGHLRGDKTYHGRSMLLLLKVVNNEDEPSR